MLRVSAGRPVARSGLAGAAAVPRLRGHPRDSRSGSLLQLRCQERLAHALVASTRGRPQTALGLAPCRARLCFPRACGGAGDKAASAPDGKEPTLEEALAEGAEAASSSTGGAVEQNKALFALPLFRKPAFPGFYHIVQIGDQDILNFLHTLRKNGQAEHLAGFMTVDLPKGLSDGRDSAEPLVSIPPGAGAASGSSGDAAGDAAGASSASVAKASRRDTGRVESGDMLAQTGTLLQIVSLNSHPNSAGGQVVVMPKQRIRLLKTLSEPSEDVPLLAVFTETIPDVKVETGDNDVRALHHEIIATMKDLLKTSFMYKDQFEQVIKYYNLDDPLKLADLVAGMSMAPRDELLAVLVEESAVERLRKVLMIVKKDLEHARLQSQLKTHIEDKFAKEQRKYMLMQHLRHIKRELNLEKDDKQTVINGFQEAINGLVEVPEEARKAMDTELGRLGSLEPQSPEFNVSRTYLDWMTALPWGKTTADNNDIEKAESILNEDHYSLEDVKERILEHMAVGFLKGSVQGKIMCLVGPPGVGKTSIGKSIARALDRKFFRFSVGGLHDVAEIRGHRRTYVGAMPGKCVQALKITGVSNPVIMIDEIDKLGRDFRGDPSSALLEVLDPEQNKTFRDLYLDTPVDLSRVLFVCTANVADQIPEPLLDRMEVIRIAGYVYEEKIEIMKRYLIPSTLESHGVKEQHIELQPEAVAYLIRDYAREAGVRELRKLMEKIVRKVALSLLRAGEEAQEIYKITTDNLNKYVGQAPFSSDRLFPDGTPPGVVIGLAWTSLGGKALFVEARGAVPAEVEAARKKRKADEPADTAAAAKSCEEEKTAAKDAPDRARPGGGPGGRLQITGKLGKVMGESSEIALTYARMFLREVQPPNQFLETASMHMNLPDGATPKDGPSAGITMTTSLLSLALDAPVKRDLALSGELTLTGKILRVGGVKEKTIAAKRENIGMIVLPMSNHADYVEIKPNLRAGLTAHFVDHFDDVYRLAFEDTGVPMPSESRGTPSFSVVTPELAAEEPGADAR